MGTTFAQVNEFPRFENKTIISVTGITTPKVVLFETTNNYGNNTVLLDKEGNILSHSWLNRSEKTTKKEYQVSEVSSEFEGRKQSLVDGNTSTSFTFSPVQENDKTITLTFPKKTEVSGILTNLDNDIIPPSTISIEADFGDGKLLPVINSVSFSSRINFSKIFVTRLKISFNTRHFLRINEIQLLTQEEVLKKDELIFFAENNKEYTLYSKPHFGHLSPSVTKYQPLSVDTQTPRFTLPVAEKNLAFNPDFDEDGLNDEIDLCPKIHDPLNTDADNNQRGDLCEDPDLDRIYSNVDNCPFIYNPNQTDTDMDGVGDKCDTEENRATENTQYLLWGVFGLMGLVLGFLVLRSLQK